MMKYKTGWVGSIWEIKHNQWHSNNALPPLPEMNNLPCLKYYWFYDHLIHNSLLSLFLMNSINYTFKSISMLEHHNLYYLLIFSHPAYVSIIVHASSLWTQNAVWLLPSWLIRWMKFLNKFIQSINIVRLCIKASAWLRIIH